MFLNEPNVDLRRIPIRLTNAGVGLPLAHVFAAGDLKLIKPDGSIANASSLPTAVAGAAAGTFEIAVAQAELTTKGPHRWQLVAAGIDFFEHTDVVDAAPGLDVVIEGPAQYDGAGEALPVGGNPADFNITGAMALRAIVAFVTNSATNLDTANGQAILKSYVGGRNRTVAQLANGNRTITSRNLT